MNIDLKSTIGKLFVDPKWVQKLLIGGLFYFTSQFINTMISIFEYVTVKNQNFTDVPMLSMLSALAFKLSILVMITFLTAIPIGYVIQSVHNQINKKDEFLPEWNNNMYFYFMNGLRYYLISFIYTVVLSFVILTPFIAGAIFLKTLNSNSFVIFSNVALFIIFSIILLLVFLLLCPLIFISFAEHFKIIDAFNLKKFYTVLSQKFTDFVMCYLLVIVVGVTQVILSLILTCTCVGIILIPFLHLPVLLVIMNLFTEVYLESTPNQLA